jgi:hypothetical protein
MCCSRVTYLCHLSRSSAPVKSAGWPARASTDMSRECAGPESQHEHLHTIALLTSVEPAQVLELDDVDVCRSALSDTSPFWRILSALTTARSLCEASLKGFFVPADCLRRVAQEGAKSPHLKRLTIRHTTAAGTAERTDAEAEISAVKLIFGGLSVQDPPCPRPRA